LGELNVVGRFVAACFGLKLVAEAPARSAMSSRRLPSGRRPAPRRDAEANWDNEPEFARQRDAGRTRLRGPVVTIPATIAQQAH
jgi:hypothetical protein